MKFCYKVLFLGAILLVAHDTANAMFARFAKPGAELMGEIASRSVRLRSVPKAPVEDLTTRYFNSSSRRSFPMGAIGGSSAPNRKNKHDKSTNDILSDLQKKTALPFVVKVLMGQPTAEQSGTPGVDQPKDNKPAAPVSPIAVGGPMGC